jgi:hypothetical protein
MPRWTATNLPLSVRLGLLPLRGILLARAVLAAEVPPARVAVYFSPSGRRDRRRRAGGARRSAAHPRAGV